MKFTDQIFLSLTVFAGIFMLAQTPASASPYSRLVEIESQSVNENQAATNVDEPVSTTGDAAPLPQTLPDKTAQASESPAPAKPEADSKEPASAVLLGSQNTSDVSKREVKQAVMPGASPADDKLKAALENVYANNPQIQAQRESLKATDEGVAQAVSGFRPDISADFSKGRERLGNAQDRWNYNNTKSRDLVVNQPIFNGGESIANFMSAKDRVKAARATLSSVEQQVIFNAVVAYTDVVEKQSVLELNQKNVDVLKQQLDATKARFDVGELTLTDVSQATARFSLAQADERQALGDLEASKATFRRIIGFDANDKISMPSVPPGVPSSLTEAKEWAKANNPILEAARHNENAAENDIYARGSALLPDVSLQGVMSRSNASSLSPLNNIDADSIKLNVSIPIYQSGAEWSRLREARNLAQQAKFNALDTGNSVMENVSIAWESYNTSKAIIVSNDAALKAAETALEGVRKENEFGVRTILDVLNAEQEAFSARVNLVKAIRAEKLQAYRLLAAIGKLTSKELGLKTDVKNPKEHYNKVKYQLLGL
jgi:TolC family type I secretion outer membrane protein